MMYLITLSSPIAVRLNTNVTRLVNVVEAAIGEQLNGGAEVDLSIQRFYDSAIQSMARTCGHDTASGCRCSTQRQTAITARVRVSNIRSKQEVTS